MARRIFPRYSEHDGRYNSCDRHRPVSRVAIGLVYHHEEFANLHKLIAKQIKVTGVAVQTRKLPPGVLDPTVTWALVE